MHLIVTEHAKHFFKMSDLPSDVKVYDDSLEWQAWKSRGDPVLHIELGKMADIMVIAPLDANTLAKMSQVSGTCLSIAQWSKLPNIFVIKSIT